MHRKEYYARPKDIYNSRCTQMFENKNTYSHVGSPLKLKI